MNSEVQLMAKTVEPHDPFLDLLTARDFGRLASCFAGDARARFLLPHGLEEYAGPEAIVRRIESWFGSASRFELAAATDAVVGRRQRLSWRFNVVREGRPEVIEQLVFLDHGDDGISRIDLLCSGFLGDPAGGPSPRHVFDAGAMGCADGLAGEFRRRLNDVPVGESFCVVVRDPAAKEDLPALARMLGQSVTSVEAHDDGRLIINVERTR